VAHPHPEDREQLTRLAEEQAALRRVATLVAEGAPSEDVFGAVAKEVSQVMQLPIVGVFRYDADAATMTVIADWSDRPHAFQPGTCWPVDGRSMTAWVQTGRPARVEDYAGLTGPLADAARESGLNRTAVAAIIVDGRVWGVMATYSPDAPLPGHVEDRLAEFTELLATAGSTSQAREDLRRLAEEQAALRRVATLAARGAPPVEVFQTLIGEVGRLLPADAAALARYEIDDTMAEVARWTSSGGNAPVAIRAPIESASASGLVFETRRPGRVNNYAEVPGVTGAAARELGWRSSVGAPVIVEGRIWGVMIVASKSDDPLPLDTEGRLAQFTDLVATAISNTESRAELMASRARIVTASDETRRRIERDLHDGAQQRLVSLALELRAAQEAVPPEIGPLRAELSRVVDGLASVLDELREFAQGIHPAILAEGGLGPALKTLGRRSAVPVELDVRDELRLPERVEVAAYYVVAEALANAAKYAQASLVHADVEVRDGVLCISVRDDGVGGADSARGSGLLGLRDRAEAIGGAMSLQSPRGGGTALQVVLPLDDRDQ
jgi:signal transduction histidine kinase